MNEIKIIYEDDSLIVLDKQFGIPANNSETTKDEFTIQDYLEKKYSFFNSKNAKEEDPDFYKRNGIVHRIDKETSGILVVAKSKEIFENLQAQFKERKVSKTYVALVHGHVSPPEGDIVVPVGRLPWDRKKFGVLAGGKEAETHYKVLKQYKRAFTLLELNPKTGRTHQIRVHLKYFNHPIFGDFLYAGRKTSRDDRKLLDRFFLHAQKISFFYPNTSDKVEFESDLSPELKKVLETIKN